MRSIIIPFTFIVLSIIVFLNCSGCQKKNKEIAPFFDGLYFKYRVITISGNSEDLFTIKEVDRGYEVILDEFYGSHNVGETVNHIVDIYGFIKEEPTRTRKASKKIKKLKDLKGRRIHIWIPPEELNIGNIFKTSFLRGSCRVIEQTTWEGWDVWVLKDIAGNKCFYDVETGFLVGSQSITVAIVGSVKIILIDTNVDIPC